MVEHLGKEILHIPAGKTPLSSDVFLIRGESRWYLFDTGRNQESLDAILALEGAKTIILSHLHRDHMANLEKIEYDALYVGDLTAERLQIGTAVTESMVIEDGVHLEIRPCPSPHTGGSLILTVNGEYTLLGDLCYTRPSSDPTVMDAMLTALSQVGTRYFVLSHGTGECAVEKDAFLTYWRQAFSEYLQ